MFQGRFRLLVSRTLQAPTSTSICSPGRPQARVYDDKVREFVENIGLENIGKRLINNREKVEFVKPEMKLDKLLAYGQLLVDEQARRPGPPPARARPQAGLW